MRIDVNPRAVIAWIATGLIVFGFTGDIKDAMIWVGVFMLVSVASDFISNSK